MISLIEAKNYRCLRYVRQSLEPFQVLVGPNASGKTTFLDVVGFLSDLVSDGLEFALTTRTKNFDDLLWQRNGDGFQLAVELNIPGILSEQSASNERFHVARYELEIKKAQDTGEIIIDSERLVLRASPSASAAAQDEFPQFRKAPDSIFASS